MNETPTQYLRRWLRGYLGDRFSEQRRSLRDVASECGVSHATLHRFMWGQSISSDIFDRIAAMADLQLLPARQCEFPMQGPTVEGAPFGPSTYLCVLRLGHPGEHEYRNSAI